MKIHIYDVLDKRPLIMNCKECLKSPVKGDYIAIGQFALEKADYELHKDKTYKIDAVVIYPEHIEIYVILSSSFRAND